MSDAVGVAAGARFGLGHHANASVFSGGFSENAGFHLRWRAQLMKATVEPVEPLNLMNTV
jgi:hypothetical protein